MNEKTRSLYGFAPDLSPFVGRTPAEQVQVLRSWGNTAIFGGYEDPAFVDAAHEVGMPVYAEFGCFVGERWWDEVPASRPITAEGVPLEAEGGYYGVNPTLPQVRREHLQALEKLLTVRAIDGVWLDFIRWPCHWEVHDPILPRTSFDPNTLARFRQELETDLPDGGVETVARTVLDRYAEEWTAWRCAQITSWVAEARAVLERVRPGALLGLFGVPWRLADREGAILTVIGQDYRALGQYVDVFSPMVYHVMCGHEPDWIGEVAAEVHALSGKPVWPIVQSVDQPTPLPAEEYGQALDVALQHPASHGVIVFTMKGVLSDVAKLEATRARFSA
jgi:hypothetical protein